jgi:hypothetical protein
MDNQNLGPTTLEPCGYCQEMFRPGRNPLRLPDVFWHFCCEDCLDCYRIYCYPKFRPVPIPKQ